MKKTFVLIVTLALTISTQSCDNSSDKLNELSDELTDENIEETSLKEGYSYIYLEKGDTQCNDDGISLAEANEYLTNDNIDVDEAKCGRYTGIVHIQICGGSTSNIHIFSIPKENITQAENLGFSTTDSIQPEEVSFAFTECKIPTDN